MFYSPIDPQIDMHLHSNFSDGCLSPKKLVAWADIFNQDIIAVADHGTIDGYLEAEKHVDDYGITLIPAIEISTYYNLDKTLHILGYFGDIHKIRSDLKILEGPKSERNIQILDVLQTTNKLYFPDNVKDELLATDDCFRSRVAKYLIDSHIYDSVEEAFYQCLLPALARVSPKTPENVIKLVRENEGVPVAAHCAKLNHTNQLDDLVREWKGYGLQGLEVYTPMHTVGQKLIVRLLAERYGLIQTGGSDFHDLKKVGLIGSGKVPYKCYEMLLRAAGK